MYTFCWLKLPGIYSANTARKSSICLSHYAVSFIAAELLQFQLTTNCESSNYLPFTQLHTLLAIDTHLSQAKCYREETAGCVVNLPASAIHRLVLLRSLSVLPIHTWMTALGESSNINFPLLLRQLIIILLE